MRIHISLTNHVEWDRTEKRDNTKKTKEEILQGLGLKHLYQYTDTFIDAENERKPYTLPVMIYYGTGRGVFDTPQRRRNFKKVFGRFDTYTGSLEARANFRQFFEWFYFLEDIERRERENRRDWDYLHPELQAVRNSIERMFPEFTNPRSNIRPLQFLIDWKQNQSQQTLRVDQLSDGYRTTLAMVMDIASRMAEANPDNEDILSTEGIVLIDEVDLHLHPGWQQRIIADLMNTFPKIQFIVTTHSPQILTTVKREQIRILGRNIERQYIAEIPQSETYAELSHDVLQAVMGVDPQPPVPEKKDLERLTELTDQGLYETKEAKVLLNRLKERINPEHSQLKRIEKSIQRQQVLKR
jgi:predicted ATP-binding protein involved in virulence